MKKQKVALVTGGSSGIGHHTARQLRDQGFVTYAAARRVGRMRELAEHGVRPIAVDLADETSIATCVKTVLEEEGPIDVLVNNAGYGSYGSIEEVTLQEARRQIEVNLFGLAALTRMVVPGMRQRRSGRIVNISSIGGVANTPYAGWYAASKFALEGLSMSLRQELAPFGVHVIIVRPGATRTAWSGHAIDSLLGVSGQGPYAVAARALAKTLHQVMQNRFASTTPERLARVIVRGIVVDRPRPIYTAPTVALIQPFLARVLPTRVLDALFRLSMRLPRTMGALPPEVR